ncbi:hypothetical protein P175DRAFT_0440682 [Aspergillus ochraceoroseus IBT 24754]|uniref:Uncharacterized protein n=2 Tax=Aspergillus ochraceoroseus TaxID=138278 RepID=A0A2T5LTW6_9EURO|nr:uncharacterized protein P175DRAFT_0440682 [Aspergillus ochraceoroseus IBT 24754]KKK15991.1 hypothetical protein AOCH_000960 [Aspergillus ochraceoroseus]PTU19717.1 hypothetical protein P175DRAFT_0440682 [Aspergillus ochraceoroseus IBT 24754]
MAIPADITLKTLKGSWALDKSVADDADPILKLQGVGWLMRKAIGAATLTLHFASSAEDSTVRLEMRQTLTGGIPGATEERIMDWAERERSNHVYGHTLTRSQFINGVRGADGDVQPDLNLQSKPPSAAIEAEIQRFLCGGIPQLNDALESEGYKGIYIHDFGRNEQAGWTAEQVWSLELISSQAYLTRRVVVVKGGSYEMARLVYKFTAL